MSFRSVIDLIKYYTYVASNLVFITVTYIESTGLLSLSATLETCIFIWYFRSIIKFYQLEVNQSFRSIAVGLTDQQFVLNCLFSTDQKKIVDFFQFLKTLSQSECWCPPLIHTKMNLIHMQIKFIFLWMVVYQALLCYWLVKIKFLN